MSSIVYPLVKVVNGDEPLNAEACAIVKSRPTAGFVVIVPAKPKDAKPAGSVMASILAAVSSNTNPSGNKAPNTSAIATLILPLILIWPVPEVLADWNC